MAKPTPESKVKKKLIDFLKSLGGDCFYYMPVQNGMGQSGIPDILCCIKGRMVALECKATRKNDPTALQAFALDRIQKSGGVAWVVDDENVDQAIANIREAIYYEHYNVGDNILLSDDLYRWKKKLEVMEI